MADTASSINSEVADSPASGFVGILNVKHPILMADASTDVCPELRVNKFKEMGLDREVGGKYICLSLDQFQIDGPNGSHFCFVYPVLGPRVSCILKADKALRENALQVVQAMTVLHSHGICHGG